jgi:hypothetical protein
MQNVLSTGKASKKLQEDLGLDYGLGKEVVSQFFDKVSTLGDGTYWEPKNNYLKLIKINGTVDEIKERVKSKILKYWGKNIENMLPEASDRRKLYMKVYKQRVKRKAESIPLPNELLLKIMVECIGHWNPKNEKGFNKKHHKKK